MLITKRWDWWRIVVIGVLGLTALTKFLSLFKPANLLFQPDPILGVKLWLVVLGAAILEIGICVFLAVVRENRKQASAVFGFAVLVLAYRAALYVNGTHFCPCLGNAVDWWPWLGAHETQVLITVALWLLFTSFMKLTQPDFELLAVKLKANSRLLAVVAPVIMAGLFLLWVRPWRYPSFGPIEGVEFSRMLLLIHHPAEAAAYLHSLGWLYAVIFAWIFSFTGFCLWIPRLVTLAIIVGAWTVLPRLLPEKMTWPKSTVAFVLFCSWPMETYGLASASPVLSALGLAVIGAGLLPVPNETYKLWRLVAGIAVLIFSACLDASVVIVFPGVLILQFLNRRKLFSSGPGQSSAATASGVSLVSGAVGLNALFVVLLISSAILILFQAGRFTGGQTANSLAQLVAGFISSLAGLMASPGTLLAAVFGAVFLLRHRFFAPAGYLLGSVVLILLVHFWQPFWPHLVLYLGFPLAILAALGISDLLVRGIHKKIPFPSSGVQSNTGGSLILGALAVSLWLGFESPNAPSELSFIHSAGLYSDSMTGILKDYEGQVKWIYTRDANLAVSAGFILPPAIIGATQAVTREQMARNLNIASQYACELLILQKDELDGNGWSSFVQAGYTNIWSNGNEAVFVSKKLNIKSYPTPEEILKF